MMSAQERMSLVQEELARRKARDRDRYDLKAYITRRSPEFERPEHLTQLTSIFDRIEKGESIFALVEAPPRHAKSETSFHGIARRFEYGTPRVAYASYSNHFAFRKSRRIRDLVAQDGTSFAQERSNEAGFTGSTSVSFWQTEQGGMFMAGGRGGGFKGEGFDLIVIDDPYKNRAEFESPVIRESIWDLWAGTLRDRVEPGGSVIIIHQRWGIDDLIGRLKRENTGRWEVVSLKAVDEGKPLWPERYDLDALKAIEEDVGEYNWRSQFLQEPIPRGEAVFSEDPAFYTELPRDGFRIAIGLDLAYSAKTKGDFSVFIKGISTGNNLYITEFWRSQQTIVGITGAMRTIAQDNPGVPWRWYVGGQEKAVAANLRKDTGARIKPMPAREDKFSRAAPVARAWNKGQVLLPSGAPWLNDFLQEISTFTGTKADRNDDIVDALAALYDELFAGSAMVRALGS